MGLSDSGSSISISAIAAELSGAGIPARSARRRSAVSGAGIPEAPISDKKSRHE
jgi:hypothetical protein